MFCSENNCKVTINLSNGKIFIKKNIKNIMTLSKKSDNKKVKRKKKMGRPKKRGPKKKRNRRKIVKIYKQRPVIDFKIVSVLNGKQNGFIGQYQTYSDAHNKLIELEEENQKIIFPRKYINKGNQSKPVNILIAKIVRALMWVVSGFIILYELGYDLNGLVAGLGVGAAVISLAAQDMVKSLLGGMAILTDKPFVIGDWIECGKYQGTVIDITYRSTRLKAANNAVITIPNSIITADYVINWNRLASRRLDFSLTLSLDTSSEKLEKITKQVAFALENDSDVIRDTVYVNVTEITPTGILIGIILYERVTDYYKYLDVRQRLICTILDVLEKYYYFLILLNLKI